MSIEFLCLYFQLVILAAIFMVMLPKRKLFLLRILLCFAISIPVCLFFPRFGLGGLEPGYLIAFALLSITAIVCFEIKTVQAFSYCIVAYAIENCAFHFFAILNVFMGMGSGSPLYFVLNYTISIAIGLVIFFGYVRELQKKSDASLGRIRLAIIAVIVLLITYLLSGFIDSSAFTFYGIIVGHCFGLMCCILALMIIFGWFMQSDLEQENRLMEKLLHSASEQQKYSESSIELINLKYHDLRYHLNREDSLDAGDTAAIAPFAAIARTECDALNVILTERCLYCDKNHIRLTYTADVTGLANLAASDIYALFGNMLDNAIEAVEKFDDAGKRFINLRISVKDRLLCIEEENYCKETPLIIDGLPVTSKANREIHGFGTRSMRFIARKYGGDMTTGCSDGIFRISIVIPLQ